MNEWDAKTVDIFKRFLEIKDTLNPNDPKVIECVQSIEAYLSKLEKNMNRAQRRKAKKLPKD